VNTQQQPRTPGARRSSTGHTAGMILIGVGVLILLSNLGILGGFGGIAGLLVLGFMGGFLLNQYHSGRKQLWMLLAGFILLGCAAATVTGHFAGAWFLGLSGAGFFLAWREDERRWWALIPAGVLGTLAAVVLSDVWITWLNGGAVFFAGLAITFLGIYSLPRYGQPWAMVPAVASAALALVVLGSAGGWVMPIVLIGIGLYLMNENRSRPFIHVDIRWENKSAGSSSQDTSGATDEEPAAAEPQRLPPSELDASRGESEGNQGTDRI